MSRIVPSLVVALGLAACSGGSSGPPGSDGGTDGRNGDGSSGDGSSGDGSSGDGSSGDGSSGDGFSTWDTPGDSPFVVSDAGHVLCGTENCACDNGVDDDGDGTTDGFDGECTGPYDNDEGSFATGIPGDNIDPDCQDCFFDGNSGSGNDGCRYATSCLEDGTPTSGNGSCHTCEPTEECVDNCRPRTPNGCDCFGCCEVYDDSGDPVFVIIGSACSLEDLDDEALCLRCEQDTDCVNDCGECELCLGRDVEDLPESCSEVPDGGTPMDGGTDADGGTPPPYECVDGTVCSPTIPCESGLFCQLGCCVPILF